MTEWRPIDTMPKDGSKVLLSYVLTADEYDDAYKIIARNKQSRESVVGYWLWGQITWFPYTASFPSNITYTHWQPLPEPPR